MRPLTEAQLMELQESSFCDDIPIDPVRMRCWDEGEVQRYFGTGGRELPDWDRRCSHRYRTIGPELTKLLCAGDSAELSVPIHSTFVRLLPQHTSLPIDVDGPFSQHASFRIPCDTAGSPSGSHEIMHRFELRSGPCHGEGDAFASVSGLNSSIVDWALSKERRAILAEGTPPGLRSDAGVRVSNRGGYQSYHDVFLSCAPSDPMYTLHALASAAMDTLVTHGCATLPDSARCDEADEGSEWRPEWRPGGLYPIDGWVNVNRASDHNVLHQHHPQRWSAVYFVSAGSAPSSRAEDDHADYDDGDGDDLSDDDEDLSGHLIFRGGPVKHRPGGPRASAQWSTHSYFAVPPVPGTLWVFAGTIPHGVMARKAPGTSAAAERPEAPRQQPRISIALNYSTARPVPCHSAPG